MAQFYDAIIIGSGPAGLTAALYLGRAGQKCIILEKDFVGGYTAKIAHIENYPGYETINGMDLTQIMAKQAEKFGAAIVYPVEVVDMELQGEVKRVRTRDEVYESHAVIIAIGVARKKLEVPGAKEFLGKGVSYCATCDGPFFKGKRMLVVGGGDAACDEAMYLAHLACGVLMIHRKDRFRAQKALAARVLANPKIEVRFSTELRRIEGSPNVSKVTLVDNKSGREYEEAVDAVFVFIGSDPKSSLVQPLEVPRDDVGYVETNERMETSVPGLYAVGDVRASPFRQLVVAASEGAIAAHAAGQYIDEKKGKCD